MSEEQVTEAMIDPTEQPEAEALSVKEEPALENVETESDSEPALEIEPKKFQPAESFSLLDEQLLDPLTGQSLQEPNKADYDDTKDYLEAILQHGKKLNQARQEAHYREHQRRHVEMQFHTFQAQEAKAKNHYADYEAVAHADFPVTELMGQAIMASDKGPDILYWLGKNKEESLRIARLSLENPLRAAQEIGRLEAKLSKPAKIQSQAPKPIKPLSSTVTAHKSMDDMSPSEIKQYLKTR
ncbi:MAG: hypothetical protein A3F10_05630 [Coxiella sp. RIFCSPHIGHO2_12_FULL_42_15]|nr:MAG: hypothetical protein A3F10_05630 [Coxiella sp. RIFCSPHIGHO2_12_FULL_42_15]